MPRILILADDLSGAADCGIACVHAGLNSVVSLVSISSRVDAISAEVVCADANTRSLDAASAAKRMRQLVSLHARDAAMLLFKKIDSTLRGHLAAELAAVLSERRAIVPGTVAVMAPAFPANGRTTVEGVHYVHGKPLHETGTWKHERMTGRANIAEMLRASEGWGLRCVHLNLAQVRSGAVVLHGLVSGAAERADVIVCDAVTDADLASIAQAAVSLEGRALWVGSAGLAHHLPSAVGLVSTEAAPKLPGCSKPVLFVIGSASGTSRLQVAALLALGKSIRGITVPPDVLLEGPSSPRWKAVAVQLCDAAGVGGDLVLVCGAEPEVEPGDRPRLSEALGEMAAGLRGRFGALVASGGETARNVLDGWGVHTLRLHGELEKGVPVSSTVVGEGQSLTVVTKAGDFGQKDTLLHCYEWLTETRTGALQ